MFKLMLSVLACFAIPICTQTGGDNTTKELIDIEHKIAAAESSADVAYLARRSAGKQATNARTLGEVTRIKGVAQPE